MAVNIENISQSVSNGMSLYLECGTEAHPYLGITRAECLDGKWIPAMPECKGETRKGTFVFCSCSLIRKGGQNHLKRTTVYTVNFC